MNSFARAGIGAVMVAGIGVMAGAAPASAECRPYQTASATGVFKGTTGIQARASWRLAVIAKDGVAYALWSKSKNSSTTCGAGKTSTWRCVARARPCS
jgi:hypothetical protein